MTSYAINMKIPMMLLIGSAAEQFFNRMIKELEQLSTDRIIEAFISGSISSLLIKKSTLDLNAVLSYESEKEDPVQ
jgi:hypothetical protein